MTNKQKAVDKFDKFGPKKEKAIELWGVTKGHISNICRAIGISRQGFYNWMEDPEFAQALVDAESELNDDIRDVLIEKAASGDMTAVIFYLKNRHPDFKQKDLPKTAIQINFNEHAQNELKEFQ